LLVLLRGVPGIADVRSVSPAELRDVAQWSNPDVVVLDRVAVGADVVELCADLAAGVVVLVADEQDEVVVPAIRAGARAVVLRDGPVDEIADAVRAVADHQGFVAPLLTTRVLESIAGAQAAPDAAPSLGALTVREREVLSMVADGESNQIIARRLTISVRTVKYHVSNILAKLDVRDRRQVILLVRGTGKGGETA
jgi:DNA-binding NarL/FixJ family response regulator